MFLSGLKPEIQKDVIKARPKTLMEAFAFTQLYEKEDFGIDVERYCPKQELYNKMHQNHYRL